MILGIFRPAAEKVIYLPRELNVDTMRIFLTELIDDDHEPKYSVAELDFSRLQFVQPVGVVVLANAIEFYKTNKCELRVIRPKDRNTDGIAFLDDAGFFEQYAGKKLSPTAHVRPSTMPLKNIPNGQAQAFLLSNVMPWIAQKVGLPPEALGGLRAAIEEIFHNVRDHSGVDFGCTFTQHFPNDGKIKLAISDFGRGIPDSVRTRRPQLNDADAIAQACVEGFTTQSNVQNRGAGLPNLIHWVTQNEGTVLIAAGTGQVSVTADISSAGIRAKLRPRTVPSRYPGTLVQVILPTENLKRSADDVRLEQFEW